MQVSAPGAPVTVMRQPVTANFLSVTRLPLAAGTDFSSESAKEAILGCGTSTLRSTAMRT